MTDLAARTIVFLNNYAGPGMGGGEVHLLNRVRGCVGADMNVHVMCVPGGAIAARCAEAGASVVDLRPPTAPGIPGAARAVASYMKGHSAEIVHSDGYLTNIVSRLAARRLEAVVINSVLVEPLAPRSEGASALGLWARGAADRATRDRVDLFLPISRRIADTIAGYGIAPARIRVIPNGIDVTCVERERAEGAVPPLPNGRALVGMAARLEPVKGADVFVEAATGIAAARDDVAFVVAGDGSMTGALEAKVLGSASADLVRLLGEVPSAIAVLSRCDIVVVPSRSEGMPSVVFEAMALGKPVVASDVGGIGEQIEDGKSGVLVPAEDPLALGDAVVALLDDPERRERIGLAARRRVTECFTLEAMVAAHMAAYRDALGARPGRSGR